MSRLCGASDIGKDWNSPNGPAESSVGDDPAAA
jgi:hypothetical protein